MEIFGINSIAVATLDNGLQVYVNQRDHAPVVSVQAWVKTGSIHEEDYLGCGLSHFLEHMLFNGSSRYPGSKVVDCVNRLGGEMNAYTSLGHTVYYVELPAAHVEQGIDIIADMLSGPLFPADKFIDEKNVILRERDMHADNPSRMLSEKVWHEMFTVHPARHPIIGYKNKIESVNREMMIDYYRRRYSPDRAFMLISGMVDADKVTAQVRQRLGSWERGGLREPFLPVEPGQHCSRNSTYTFKDPLSRVSMSWHIPPGGHHDIPALDILSGILGQSKSSRLVRNLKIRKDLAMSVSAYSYTPPFCGVFGITALCTPENTMRLEEELLREAELLREGKFRAEELAREVLQLSTDYLRALRSNNSVARIIGNSILAYGSPAYVDRYLADLKAVTLDDLARVCSLYFNPEKSTVVKLVPDDSGKVAAPAGRHLPERAGEPLMSSRRCGARLLKLRNPELPLVDVGVVLRGGTFFESAGNAGISSLVAAMLSAGTASFNEMELLHLLDENAMEFSVTPGNNSLSLRLNCHKDRLPLGLDILKSILSESVFPDKEFKREKRNSIDKRRSREASPQGMAEDRMAELLYGHHPYALPRHGSRAGLEALDAGMVKDFYYRVSLSAAHAVFGIAGDFDANSGEMLERMIDSLPWSSQSLEMPGTPRFPESPLRETLSSPRNQAVVLCAIPGCDNVCGERFVIDILQAAMNGQGANIFKKIRDDAGLAYYTGMSTSRGFHRGDLVFYAGTHAEGAETVAAMMEEERVRLASKGLSRREFDAAKAGIAHSNAGQMENSGSMMMQACLAEYYGNGYSTAFDQQRIFDGISFAAANRVIKKIMSCRNTVTVISIPST